MDGYVKYIQSDKLGPHSKLILNHTISDYQKTFTILDVISICYRTVAAYHYFTTFCDQDKTAPLPMVHPAKTVQQNEQVKTIPLKLIPATSSASPPSHPQVNDNQQSHSKNFNIKSNMSINPNSITQKKSEDKTTISITTLIPNLNTNRPQSPPVLPKNLIPNQTILQSRAQSPPQSLWQQQSQFHHSQYQNPINANMSTGDISKYLQQLREKNLQDQQQQNIPQQTRQNAGSSPQPKNQSRSPPAQFSPQQIVSDNRSKQRQQHVGSPPTQNIYPNMGHNGWHSLTSDPSCSDSTTAPEFVPDLPDQAPIGQELIAQIPNCQQPQQQNNQKNINQQQDQKQMKQNHQQQRKNQQKQENSNDATSNNSTATDWKPTPISKSPPNSNTTVNVEMGSQKPNAKTHKNDHRIKCPFCSATFDRESFALNHLISQHGFTKEFDKAFRYAKDGITCIVCHKTMKCYDYVISHAAYYHYQLFEDLVYNINDTEPIRKFMQHIKNKIPLNQRKKDISETQSQDSRCLKNVAIQTETPEDLFDDSYCNFIASSIDTKGLAAEKIELSKFEPIEIEMIQENLELFEIPVDAHFWKQLDMLEALMKGTDKATFEDERFFCKICNVKCKSNATLLQHCFEQHRDLLDSFD